MKIAISKYSCIINADIPQEIYTMLQEECIKHDIKNISKDQVIKFIKEHDERGILDDVNFIYHAFTKTKPPDISQYIDRILRLNDQFDDEFDLLTKGKRKNALNVYYKLYIFLKKLHYKCTLDDFISVKSKEKLLEYEQISQRAFENLGWKWINSDL